MGLDVYVGSLARYYLGDWETIVQQIGRQQGFRVDVRRPPTPPRGIISRVIDSLIRRKGPSAAVRDVERWRKTLGRASGLRESFRWNEDLEYEYFTDKPAWDCYGALVLWASYDQLPSAIRAANATEWSDDPAYLTALLLPDQRYPHLLADTEIWFPVRLPSPFDVTSITGSPIRVGSSIHLLEELEQLNARTWRASDETVACWRTEGAEYGAELEKSARLGFAVFYELAKLSIQHKLPMKLDY